MRTSLASLSPRALLALAAGGVLLWAVLLWFLYVSPHRSEAARLGDQVAAAELQLGQALAAARHPARASSPVSDVFRLEQAMPASRDQAGLVLELARLAKSTGVTLDGISSEPSAEGVGGTTMIPVTVTASGKFSQIARFLHEARSLVSVRRGKVQAAGRLFSVQSLEIAESHAKGFPQLDATIALDAYVYDGPITPVAPSGSGSSSDTNGSNPSASAAAAGGAR